MSDRFTEITTTSYGQRIINSLFGTLIGFLLFISSFVVLYLNEGREDLSKLARTAREVSSSQISTDKTLEGSLVCTTGSFQSKEMISDNMFLAPGNFIILERQVEMYAWAEHKELHTKKNLGGSETTETIYNYSKAWVKNPQDTQNFKHQEGHQNPSKSLPNSRTTVKHAQIGVYDVDVATVKLPLGKPLTISKQNTRLSSGATLANDMYVFVSKTGTSTFENPTVGDLRISYNALEPVSTATLFGKLQGSTINTYTDQHNHTFYRLFIGNRDQALMTLHQEYQTSLWLIRLVGFLMMFFGLFLLFGLISTFLDIVPIFGTVSQALISIIMFIISAVLATITIVASMVIHNFIAFCITIFLVFAFLLIIVARRLKRYGNKKSNL